jgi:hypothetical protein
VCYAATYMRQSVNIALGALLVLGVGALLWKNGATSSSSPAAPDAGAADVALRARSGPDAGWLDEAFLGDVLARPDAGGVEPVAATDSSSQALPAGAPKVVRLGVILIQYRGAQGAVSSSRSRDDAAVLARAVAEAAKSDFKAQVGKGDEGSLEDAGRIPRGVLEPATEYTVFTMSKGAVSEPLDTPRGFWIVKRID